MSKNIYVGQHSAVAVISNVCVCVCAVHSSIQDVFDWVFEILDTDAVRDDTGRLAFTIEYELASAGAPRGHVQNKVATRVQIQPDTTFAIVPVVKVSS